MSGRIVFVTDYATKKDIRSLADNDIHEILHHHHSQQKSATKPS